MHCNNARHQQEHVAWMLEGFARHGVSGTVVPRNIQAPGDIHVVWGWKQPVVIAHCKAEGKPILVMERGHLQPRMEFTSLGWGGLARRGRYPGKDICGDRWRKHWGAMEPWKDGGEYALVIGQVDGDASLYGVNFNVWAQKATNALLGRGLAVRYRPHPLMLRNDRLWRPDRAEFSTRTLAEDLAGAAVCVTYNSTTCVEAVLAGVPTVTSDEGAMAWPVTSHSVDAPAEKPDRREWADDLACCQWSADEIRTGEAWEAVREVMQ